MSYMNQELKKTIVEEVKKVLPSDWKVSFRTDRCSITLTIISASKNLPAMYYGEGFETKSNQINQYYIKHHCQHPELAETLIKIQSALDCKNWDHSDSMTDYFNVGYYTHIQFGRWDKPFVVKA